MTEKVYTWDKRQPVKFPPGTSSGPHLVYFFRKSFEDCTSNTMSSLAHGIIETSERAYGVVYTPEAQTLIIKSTTEPVQDPLLKAIFGFKCNIDQRSVLDYYEKYAAVNDRDYMPFVDLCVLMGEQNRAQKFADRVGKEFEILKILDQAKGQIQSEILRMDAIQMWLEKAPKNLAAARLTSIIHRCAESANGECQLRSLAELWGEGFYWDALCLISILMPNNPVLTFMKENIPRFLKHHDSGFLAGVLNSLNMAVTNQKGPIVTAFDNAYLKHLHAISLYRIVKIDIYRNEKNTTSDIEKLGVRARCSEALRFVLLIAMAQLGPLEAKTLAGDALSYIKTLGNAVFDYFPAVERMLFEKFVGMIADMYSVVTRVLQLKPATSSTVPFENEKNGFTSIIFAKWRKEYAEVWAADGYWARSAFMQTCQSLLNHLISMEKIMNATNDSKGKALKLALKLCSLFASDDFIPAKCGIRHFQGIAEEFGFSRDQVQTVGNAFTYKEGSEASFSGPVHLTGDQFISSIKQQSAPSITEKEVAARVSTSTVIEQVHPAEEAFKNSEAPVARGGQAELEHQAVGAPASSSEISNSQVAAERISPVSDTTAAQEPAQIETREPAVSAADNVISQESVTLPREGSVSAASETRKQDHFEKEGSLASRTADWNNVQQERLAESSFEIGSVNMTMTATTDTAEPTPMVQSAPSASVANTVPQQAAVLPASAPVPIPGAAAQKAISRSQYSDDGWGDSPQKDLPVAQPSQSFCNRAQFEQQTQHIQQQQVCAAPSTQPSVSVAAPNALDNLLNSSSLNGAGDATAGVPAVGQPVQSNAASRTSSINAAAVCDDSRSTHSVASSAAPMTATSTPVQQQQLAFGAPTPAASSTSSAPQQKFAIGGFEQASGDGGFGNFGSFGSMSGGGGGGRGGGRTGGYGGSSGGFQGGSNFGHAGGQGGSFGGNRGGQAGGSGYRGGGGNFRGGDAGRGRGAPRGSFNRN